MIVILRVVVCSTKTRWACWCNSFVDFHEHKEQCKIENGKALEREREREREREIDEFF